jgi:hypothetical protein
MRNKNHDVERMDRVKKTARKRLIGWREQRHRWTAFLGRLIADRSADAQTISGGCQISET